MDNNISRRGLRPFQPVVYITESIYEQLKWKGHHLQDIFSFKKVITSLGEDDILSFLALNSTDPNRSRLIQYPFPLGIDSILMQWNQGITNNDEDESVSELEELKNYFKRISDSVKVNMHYTAVETTLSMEVDEPTEETNGYIIVHNESFIFVVFKKNDRNLLDIKSQNKTLKLLVKDIIRIYNNYFDYNQVSITKWFGLYLNQL